MTANIFAKQCAGALLLFFSMSAVVEADYIVMKNGDRITGSITRIWAEELTIQPEYADEFAVDTSAIVEMVSEETFDLELADGTELAARLNGVGTNGEQILVSGDAIATVPLADISGLREPESYFSWDGNVDANSIINSGNTDSRALRIRGTTNLKIGDHRHTVDATLADESLDGSKTKKQRLVSYNHGWLFRDALFLNTTVSHERDPIRNLEDRTIIGSGLGYELWNDADRRLTFAGGLGYKSEQIADQREKHSIAFWSLRFSRDLLGGDLAVFHNHNINSNLTGRDNTIAKTSTGVRFEITDLLYLNLEVTYDYESNPAPGAENEDFVLAVGVGAEF